MPYNTTAIPPRKEVTGQTQLPLTRVKKIVAVDQDIAVCSNNAAFAITLATELFIQHLADQAQNEVKLERKPRRNIQYKDLANAVLHHDNLEFLEDVVPKTTTLRQVKDQAAATRAKLRGETKPGEGDPSRADDGARPSSSGGGGSGSPGSVLLPNGKKQKAMLNGSSGSVNGSGSLAAVVAPPEEDPSAQLELEMRQASQGQGKAHEDGDIDMTG